jgi:predicted DNA-binding transcriptional regulator AlpA
MTPLPMLNQEQAAALLAVEPRTLEAWRLKGGGPQFVRLSRRCVRYRPADLEAWIAARVAASTSTPLAA